MLLRLLAVTLLPVVAACAAGPSARDAIFAVEQATAELGETPAQRLGFGDLPYARPSPTEVGRFHDALSSYLLQHPDISIRPLSDYRFQILGLSYDGRPMILGNAFCRLHWPDEPDWRMRLVVVDDGGDCFFQALFDSNAGSIVELFVNGEA